MTVVSFSFPMLMSRLSIYPFYYVVSIYVSLSFYRVYLSIRFFLSRLSINPFLSIVSIWLSIMSIRFFLSCLSGVQIHYILSLCFVLSCISFFMVLCFMSVNSSVSTTYFFLSRLSILFLFIIYFCLYGFCIMHMYLYSSLYHVCHFFF